MQYELRLTASDNLKENYTTVVIHVKDVNDNPPVFERPNYRTQITEEDDRTLPKRVLGVIASLVRSIRFNFRQSCVSFIRERSPSRQQSRTTLFVNSQLISYSQVTATDGDKDRPQNIVYFLTGQGIDPDNPANSKFDINRTTGEIFVLKVRISESAVRR